MTFVASNGKYITASLFLETSPDKKFCKYTLKNKDHTYKGKVYPSLKRLYLELEDLEEYTFATQCLEDWNHWEALTNSTWFGPIADQWRFELSKKLNSRSLLNLKQTAMDDQDKNFIQANRLLLSRTEELKTNNAKEQKAKVSKKVGRPEKDKKSTSPEEDDVLSDYNRIMGIPNA